MRSIKSKALSMALSLMICASAYSSDKSKEYSPVDFTTHEIRPFAWEEKGIAKGFAVEIVNHMFRQRGYNQPITFVPFKRGLKDIQTENDKAFFIMARRPERENQVKWVGPMIMNGVYFYIRKGAGTKLTTLEDMLNLSRIGVASANADHAFLKSKGFKNLEVTSTQKQSLLMLESGRVDAIPVGELVFPELVKELGLSLEQFQKTAIKLYDSELYIGFSKNIPDEKISLWQSSLDKIKGTQEYKLLVHQYFYSLN